LSDRDNKLKWLWKSCFVHLSENLLKESNLLL